MASFQLPFRDNPTSSVAVHDHAADTTSSDNENQHAEGLNSNVAAHARAAGDASSDNKDETTEEAKYSNPVNGHLPPQPGDGPPFDLIEDQQGKIKWFTGYTAFPEANWVKDINVAGIRYMVGNHIHHIGLDKDDFEVEFFTEGCFNKLYTIRKASQPPGSGPEYIFRAALPTYPWYKLESEIATMELVRMYTDIPVPKVYVYDSDANNAVQYEWMIMDKVKGIPFLEARESMSMEQKTKLAETLADWTHQLSTLRFDKIGSIYRRRLKPATSKTDFKVGPLVDQGFTPDWRLDYKLHRGPYTSIEQFLRAFIDVHLAEVIDPRQKQRSEYSSARDELKLLTTNPDDCDKGWELERITTFLEKWAPQTPESKQARIDQLREPVSSYEASHDDDVDTVHHERGLWNLIDIRGNPSPDPVPETAAQCQALLYAVPHMCPAEALPLSSCVLHHEDISVNNVLIDPATGNATALVDWEEVRALPFALIDPYPSAINDGYNRSIPPRPLRPNADEDDRYMYQHELELYENFQLRKVFRQRLEQLGSPCLEAFDEKDAELKNLLQLARVADMGFIGDEVKELVQKLEEEIGRGF